MREDQATSRGERGVRREVALAELQSKLADGLARARLSKTQLAVQAKLGRTTMHGAFRGAGLPSAETVVTLARVLRLPEQDLLELQRAAAADIEPFPADGGVGRPIPEWHPYELEVHPVGPAPGRQGAGGGMGRVLSGYVQRSHDGTLADAVHDVVQGRSRLVVLVGTSSTGKTRACWEAVQPLAEQQWRLWHPVDPTRAEAARNSLHRVGPRTVVWLNEAQPRQDGILHLPGTAASLKVVTPGDSANGAAAVHDPHRQTLTAIARVSSRAFALLDPATQNHNVNGWGRALAGIARTGHVATVQVLERTVPDSGDTLARHWALHGQPETPVAGQIYSELVASAGPAAAPHETYIAISLDLKAAKRLISQAG